MGVCLAATIKVGHYLGAGEAVHARNSVHVTFTLSCKLGVVLILSEIRYFSNNDGFDGLSAIWTV